jgi:hypothetical protein
LAEILCEDSRIEKSGSNEKTLSKIQAVIKEVENKNN